MAKMLTQHYQGKALPARRFAALTCHDRVMIASKNQKQHHVRNNVDRQVLSYRAQMLIQSRTVSQGKAVFVHYRCTACTLTMRTKHAEVRSKHLQDGIVDVGC